MEETTTQTNSANINSVDLKFTGIANFKPTIYVDGKVLKYKRDNFGSFVTTYTTNKPTVNVEIKKLFDISGPMWVLTSLFFFVFSIFGIFDLKPDKRCVGVLASFKINVTSSCSLKVSFKARTQTEKAFEIEAKDCEIVDETGNNYFIDTVAKKRYKTMRIVKIFLWLALIGVVGYLLYLKFSAI